MRNRFVFVTRKAACFASEMRFVAQFRDYTVDIFQENKNFSCCKNAEKELKNIFIKIANGKSLK